MGGAGAKYHGLREDYPGHTNGESLANGEENLEVSVCVDGLKLKSSTTVSDKIEKQLVDKNCLSIVFLMLQSSCQCLMQIQYSLLLQKHWFLLLWLPHLLVDCARLPHQWSHTLQCVWSLCLINLIREQLSKTKVFCVIFLRLCNLHHSACTYKCWILETR
jgi:hypothetical protein